MLSRKLAILGGATGATATAGGTGATIYLSSEEEQNEEEDEGEHTSEIPSQERNIAKETNKSNPGRDIVEVHGWLKLGEKVKGIKDESKCTTLGWEWRGNECTVPAKITKFSHLETEDMGNQRDETSCISAGGNWWWKNGGNKCKTRDIILREKFKEGLNNWEVIGKDAVAGKITGSNEESLRFLNENGYWEVKKHENDYAVIFLKSKLRQDQIDGNWEFPSYYNIYNKNSVKVSDVCSMLENLAGEGEDKGLYLYNENKRTFWDCRRGGFTFVSY